VSEWVSEWMNELMSEWVSERMNKWVIEWMNERMNEWTYEQTNDASQINSTCFKDVFTGTQAKNTD